MDDSIFQVGDRVEVVVDCPGAAVGDTAIITQVHSDEEGHVRSLTILVDTSPARTHGTTVLPHEVRMTTRASEA